jgi:hypothetical protein
VRTVCATKTCSTTPRRVVVAHELRGCELRPSGARLGLNDVGLVGRLRDWVGAARYDSPSLEPLDKWKMAINTPVRGAWTQRYLGSSNGSTAAAELRAATPGPQSPSRPEREQTCRSV